MCLGACVIRGPGTVGTCTGWCFFGDPHLLTADGAHVEFQAAGEFIVARSEGDVLEVQARFEPPVGATTVTLTSAVAMRVAGDRVAFYADATRPLVINGEVIDRVAYATTLPGGGVVERLGSQAIVIWPDGSRLELALYSRFVNFALSPSDALAPALIGVLGRRDGDQSNDLVTRDGLVLDRGVRRSGICSMARSPPAGGSPRRNRSSTICPASPRTRLREPTSRASPGGSKTSTSRRAPTRKRSVGPPG
jgi:hypothetical protein